MGMIINLLVNMTSTLARRVKGVTREKLAKLHEEIAQGIRDGKYVPDEAIAEYDDDAERMADAFAGLPD
jgi:hypothetical protein